MTPQAPRPKRAAAAAASRATTEQFNLPDVDELFAPIPVAKRRRVQNEAEVETDAAPTRPKRAAAAAASRSITDQYSLTLVNRLSASAPVGNDEVARTEPASGLPPGPPTTPLTRTNTRRATRSSGEIKAAPTPAPPVKQTRGRAKAVLAPPTPPALAKQARGQTKAALAPPTSPSLPKVQKTPRRSSRVAQQPKGVPDEDEEEPDVLASEYVSDEGDSASDNEDLDDETPDSDYMVIPRADSDDGEEIESPEPAKDATAAASKVVIGENGLVYVGEPPREDAPFVLAGPFALVKSIIAKVVHDNYTLTDAKLSGADRPTIASRKLVLRSRLRGSLTPHGEDRFGLICDYTGLDMSWAPGSRARSLEAFYQFILSDGQLMYHEGVNVGFITAPLNWTKRTCPPTVLPLLAHMLRSAQEPDFQARKGAMTWGYIALRNVGISGHVLNCHGPSHKSKAEEWARWDRSKLNDALEELRTAKRGPATRQELAKYTPRQLLGKGAAGWLGYGLTHDEFQYYCTAASPSGSRQRVFYPFHILSRPEAEELQWDWGTLYARAHRMLHRMRTKCNKHAEKAGYGEPKLDPLRLIVWWWHHLCGKIQQVKAERPTATQEEIAFGIVDRWGLPVLPWVQNPLRASLCKTQDHSIAMVSGLAWPDGEEFDPVKHFDLDRSTMTIDTKGTNMAMRDFATSAWAGIREVLMAVPLRHPLWQIDPAAGLAGWVGTWHTKLPTPQPPVPPFNIPLLPIDPWMDSSLALPPLRCAECHDTDEFQAIGLLVRHYRTHHAGGDENTSTAIGDAPSAEQDKVDEEFWAGMLKELECRHCGTVFPQPKNRVSHEKRCPQSGAEAPYQCTVEGCPDRFWSPRDRNDHLGTFHGRKVYRCENCNAVYTSKVAFLNHQRAVHNVKTLSCTVANCPDKFWSERDRNDHLGTFHGQKVYRCVVDNCDAVYMSRRGFTRHKRAVHNVLLDCTVASCPDKFTSRSEREEHLRTAHANREYRCTTENCDAVYTSARALSLHKRPRHNEGLLICRKGCPETFIEYSSRAKHETEQHPDAPPDAPE
ncbi:hypothetical protein B0I37DRAFT_350008 [Chaetomium sp. MPI-CAGE-AT-0009]|nr:hypothetical protein B0I37DRAFT_350008 [Chaetomium sp. MPI-CAGE-AT-0009]